MPDYIPSLSSDEVFIGQDTSVFLTPTLDTMEATIAGKAASNHVHSGYADTNHTHTGYAASAHAHAASEITGLSDALALKADVSAITAKADLVNGKIPVSQLPSFVDDIVEYAGVSNFPATGESGKIYVDTSTNAIYRWGGSAYVQIPTAIAVGDTPNCAHRGDHGKHAYDHSINGDHHVTPDQKRSWSAKAEAVHSHPECASSDHTHCDLFSADGGTINGAIDVKGVIKAEGQQAFYYNTTANSQTIGTNNATGGTNIACGSSATVGVGGALMKTPTVVPKATNAYYCGNTNFRWKGIYSTAAVNVSSDRRLKRDINYVGDAKAFLDFINGLKVATYNYNDDEANAQARIGLIAQDVQEVNADLAKFFVSEDENGMLGMTPSDLVFALISAVQQLSAEVAELKASK